LQPAFISARSGIEDFVVECFLDRVGEISAAPLLDQDGLVEHEAEDVGRVLLSLRADHELAVLVVEHNDEGALGLVLNRPSETSVGETVEQPAELVGSDEQIYIGGPVQPSAVILLAAVEDAGGGVTAGDRSITTAGARRTRAGARDAS